MLRYGNNITQYIHSMKLFHRLFYALENPRIHNNEKIRVYQHLNSVNFLSFQLYSLVIITLVSISQVLGL